MARGSPVRQPDLLAHEGEHLLIERLSEFELAAFAMELRERGGSVKTYNAMQMFTPDGNLSDIYRKSALVPFGETNPFEAIFPGLSDYLQRTTGAVRFVGVEGAFAPFNFSKFRRFPEKGIVREVCSAFLAKDLIAAPAFAERVTELPRTAADVQYTAGDLARHAGH